NRVVANANGAIVQSNHYYPYGMSFTEGNQSSSQPYKFGGKELDTQKGLNLYDFVARMQDSVLGIFSTPDPLAEDYYSWSPYAYCMNNPILYIDPDGRAWRPTYDEDHDGNRIYNGYEWIPEDRSYDADGNLLSGLYAQAVFFSYNGTFDASSKYNMGSSTATVYLADGTTTTFDANTNPSSDDYATVPEGTYHATVGLHKGSYTALKMRDEGAASQTIELGQANPAHSNRTYAEGINIHKPGLNNLTGLTSSGSAVSQGCLLIDRNKWSDFIGNFNTDTQRKNTVSVTVSRTMSTPVNINRPPLIPNGKIMSISKRIYK
uniref:RHS repeat-associated core domain-containing protein n=1 Tax=Bacteroides sp. UBA939 TaxID=1946092 RepID=UPI0025BC0E2C